MANDEIRLKVKIDTNTNELVLMKQQVQDLGKSFTEADSFANTFIKRINIAGHIYAGYQALNNTLGTIVNTGIEANRTFENLTNSLTTLRAVSASNIDSMGNLLTIQQKYNMAQQDAKQVLQELLKVNSETPHTLNETAKIYDSMYLGMKKIGASNEDMIEITKKISIAAGNRMNFDALLSAMDGLATGTVEANSEMGRFLSSVGLTNEEIKNSSNVVQLFKDKLSGFQAIDSFDTRISNLNNSFMILAGTLTKPLFDNFSKSLIPASNLLNDLNNSLIDYQNNITKVQDIHKQNNISILKNELIDLEKELINAQNASKRFYNEWGTSDEAQITKIELLIKTTKNKIKDLENAPKLVDKFDSKPIDDLVNKTLNPYSAKVDEINKKWQNSFEDFQKNGKDTSGIYKAWMKELSDLDKEEADKKQQLLKNNEKTLEEQNKKVEELNKAYNDLATVYMTDYEKQIVSITDKTNSWIESGVSVNDALTAQAILIDNLNNKKFLENTKEDLSYYQKLIELKSDSYEKSIELANINYAQNVLNIEGMDRPITEKEKLIGLESELYEKTKARISLESQVTDIEETANSYEELLDSQISLLDATSSWNNTLEGVAGNIGNIAGASNNLAKVNLTQLKNENQLRSKYEIDKLKFSDDQGKLAKLNLKYAKDKAILEEQGIQAQLNGYSNIAGAMSSMFEQGSRDAAAFQLVESGLALASGIRAILTQGSGDPYTAFARIASMTALVSSMLGNLGIVFGMNSNTTSTDAFSSMTANNGAGTVLGDSEAQTKSITESLSILQDFAQPQFETLIQMNKYLASIDQKIGGVSSLLIQGESFALGKGYEGYTTDFKNKISLNDNVVNAIIGGGVGLALSKLKIPIVSDIAGMFGGIVNSVLGGLFGKTSTSQSMTDSGIYFAEQLLIQAIDDFTGSAYQTIKTTTTTKSWFGSSSNSNINSYFQGLNDEIERQFTLILDGLYNTVLLSGEALDKASSETAKSLANFNINIGKVSLMGKTGEEIQQELTSVFGKVGDDIAKTAFPLLIDFQQVGEGMFETLTRVSVGMEEAEYFISRLGNRFTDITYTMIGHKQGEVGFEALLQSITGVEKALYPTNNGLLEIIDNLDSTAEELYAVYTSLDELRDRLIFIGQSAQGISNSMIYGAGSIDALNNGFSSYFQNFLDENEQLAFKTSQLSQSFNDLGLSLPVSKDSFKALLSGIDLTSSAGQELYGRLIILSESFADIADSTAKSIENLTTSLTELSTSSFDTFISSLDAVGQSILSLKQTALSFINGFSASDESLKEQIISYNKLRDEFNTYFDSNGNIKAGANKDDLTSLYSSMTSLATSISGKDSYLKDSLISQISNDLTKFNNSEDILKVNIVDGLGALLGLNSSQLAQLQSVASDGKITNNELNSISGLTQIQKDKIIDFAKNSEYFSTEDTLSSLNEYMKKQLEVLQQTQEAETASLSKSTFTYGDYIGKQEQIDIAKLLGISYESAKPLIEKVQALSISKNPQADLYEMLGFTFGTNDTSYDVTTAKYLSLLSPYMNVDPTASITQVKGLTSFNNNALNTINTTQATYEKEWGEYLQAWNAYLGLSVNTPDYKQMPNKDTAQLGRANISYYPADESKMLNLWDNMDLQGREAISAYVKYKNAQKVSLFANGGYTGDIPINAVAGFVHGQEYVLDANVTKQVNSIGSVADMINQYTNTNLYEKMNQTFTYMKDEISNLVNITISQANEIKKLRKEVEIGGIL